MWQFKSTVRSILISMVVSGQLNAFVFTYRWYLVRKRQIAVSKISITSS
jgi:hypothetical protein